MEAQIKEEEPKVEEYDINDNEDDEDEGEMKNKISYEQQLLNAAKKGDYELAEKCINKKANINTEEPKKKWTPLVWAACKGHLNILKLLLAKGAGQQYTVVDPQNRIVIMGTNKQVKPTPLQWASFKGHYEIFLHLIKAGLHWEDVDVFGNNSVNLAAAGNHLEIFKLFLQLGVLINVKNSRGHAVKELTTDTEILRLAKQYEKAEVCPLTKHVFKENEIKHWCWVCKGFFKAGCDAFKLKWVPKDAHSEEKIQIDGRCKKCWEDVEMQSKALTQAMESYDLETVSKVMEEKKAILHQVDKTLLDKALVLKQKLRTQAEILQYLSTLAHVPNYKIILKAVDTIQSMLRDAQQRKVELDKQILATVNKEKERLIAERNLRYLLDNIDASVAKRDEVQNLEQVFAIAQQKQVAAKYLEVANQLKVKMGKAILAQDLYQMFVEYPLRPDPYPDPLMIDPKTKRPLDPATKKPTDPVNLLPKKKKGKKQPKFVIPEWATELKAMNEKIKELEELIKMKEELNLSGEFVHQCVQSIALMKKESRYRRDVDELERMVEEANKKPKK